MLENLKQQKEAKNLLEREVEVLSKIQAAGIRTVTKEMDKRVDTFTGLLGDNMAETRQELIVRTDNAVKFTNRNVYKLRDDIVSQFRKNKVWIWLFLFVLCSVFVLFGIRKRLQKYTLNTHVNQIMFPVIDCEPERFPPLGLLHNVPALKFQINEQQDGASYHLYQPILPRRIFSSWLIPRGYMTISLPDIW